MVDLRHAHAVPRRRRQGHDQQGGQVPAAPRPARGVATLIAIGSGFGVASNAQAVALAQSDARIFATIGVHPHDASEYDAALRRDLEGLLTEERVVAVGECGLDYHYLKSPREAQRRCFAEQLGLARDRGLPVSLHVRGDEPDAFGEALELWRSEGGGSLRGVLHCYTGQLDFALRALDEGLEVSLSGILTFKKDRGLREVARGLPLARLLVETDAPLLAPEGHRGKRNEPALVVRVGETLAALHGRPLEEVAETITRNAVRLFGLERFGVAD